LSFRNDSSFSICSQLTVVSNTLAYMTQFNKSFENFEWLDLDRPAPKQLEQTVKPFEIDHILLDDALEHGHLPKLEKQKDFTFIIFWAFSVERHQNYSTFAKLSNKVAFLLNDSHLITIHQKPFAFLDKLKDRHFSHPEELMLAIVLEMLLTFEPPINWLSDKMDDSEKEIFLKKHGKISIEQLYFQK